MLLYYDLDERDRILLVSDGWDEFAHANDGGDSCAENVVGTRLWDHVKDAETSEFLRRLLVSVRRENRSLRLPFNCHGTDRSRALSFEAAPTGVGGIRITTRLLEETPWTAQLLDRRAERSQELVRVCSWCNRGHLHGAWLTLDRVGEVLGLFLAPRVPRVTHGICEDCVALLNVEVPA